MDTVALDYHTRRGRRRFWNRRRGAALGIALLLGAVVAGYSGPLLRRIEARKAVRSSLVKVPAGEPVYVSDVRLASGIALRRDAYAFVGHEAARRHPAFEALARRIGSKRRPFTVLELDAGRGTRIVAPEIGVTVIGYDGYDAYDAHVDVIDAGRWEGSPRLARTTRLSEALAVPHGSSLVVFAGTADPRDASCALLPYTCGARGGVIRVRLNADDTVTMLPEGGPLAETGAWRRAADQFEIDAPRSPNPR
jgi:hypothetical protein